MASLVDAANVHSTCLRILKARGYALSVRIGPYEDDTAVWSYRAQRASFDFEASEPISLLGLTAIYEEKQPDADTPYWWVVEGEDVFDVILGEALEHAFFELLERDPVRWQAEVVAARSRSAAHDISLADALGISADALCRARARPEWPGVE